MSLTHVSVWDSRVGYRRVTVEEADAMYPNTTVSAKSGHFVCELCAQNVCFTAKGTNARHFRHDSAAQNKTCEERQQSYSRIIQALNNHPMPLRIQVNGSQFVFQLGFFRPPDKSLRCDRITITGDSHQTFQFSFDRIESIGTTFLGVGSIPSRNYWLQYDKSSPGLEKYWDNKVPGVEASGSFFECDSGKMLYPRGKAYWGKTYYLLRQTRLYVTSYDDIDATEVAKSISNNSTWYLYRIKAKQFSARSARFFLKYSIFLTDKPTKFYPIWPAYIEDPYFIYHNAAEFYFYLCGDDAELKSYPATANVVSTDNGRLYRISTRDREQLISLGKSGSLGFSYLVRKELNQHAPTATVAITDVNGRELTDNIQSALPKSRIIFIDTAFDGKVSVLQNGNAQATYRLVGHERLSVDAISFGTEILVFQGLDLVQRVSFEKITCITDPQRDDERLVKALLACKGEIVTAPHSLGTMLYTLSDFPLTQQWLRKAIHKRKIPRSALQLLKKHILKKGGENVHEWQKC